MLNSEVVLKLVVISSLFVKGKFEDFPVNEALISSLRNDANLDLPIDEEYEDLRAELLAYHTALATLSDTATRRSMKSSPCWTLGGICINYKLCEGYRYITEVPGCKDKLTVCCFAWNKFYVRDLSDYGLYNIAFPWGHPQEFGGKGVVEVDREDEELKIKKKSKKIALEATELLEGDPALAVKVQEAPVLRSMDIYNIAFPRKDPKEFEKKRVIEFEPEVPQIRKKELVAKEMPENKLQEKSILRILKSNFPFLWLK